MTGVSECSQQRGNLKDDGYIPFYCSRLVLDSPDTSASGYDSYKRKIIKK
ncbi:hypothetical protein ABLB90_08825 [Photorhabdus bodei]|uniref:Uncharacterized protein n=1 Tax=Photorhabdus kayaii TaxID=230088 RepID=A0ABX0AV85_9GAMM|nr:MULTISPECIES: hypothetical protein [Photorhabdus]MCC8374372.1 hypothetical protein [Photorhabdus bodei]MDB6367454.1 hypothetical protein [Photorhabdus bodei]NDK94394.1 hypothetical protein [Photorhabdus laumondii subsp. laumondii]NDL10316.1 hypothetical protein [Photorhabdus kayaii]NDL23811.1 hypothetical protein [Photorhabdus kayaii]